MSCHTYQVPWGTVMRIILALALTSCSFLANITSPDPVMLEGDWDIILPEWQVCQDTLHALGVTRARLVHARYFTWRRNDGPIYECMSWSKTLQKEVPANGCYMYPEDLIIWNTKTPRVIRHECGHAILRRLGYKCSSDYEHEGGCP